MNRLSEEDFAALFRDAYPRLWTVAAAIIGDRDQAEDLVQDAAMTGLRRLSDFEPGTNFVAWMAQIVRYNALNHRKQRARRKADAAGGHELADEKPAPAVVATAVDEAGELIAGQHAFDDRVAAGLADLDPDRRACLLLRIVHGLSYEEISATLGVPAGTAMSHVHRAKATLRRTLGEAEQRGRGSDG